MDSKLLEVTGSQSDQTRIAPPNLQPNFLNEFYKKGMSRKKFPLDRRARGFCLEIQPTSL